MILGIDASRANVRERTGTERYSFEVIRRLPALLPDVTIRLYSREPLLPDLQDIGPNVESVVLDWPPKIMWTHLRLGWEVLWHKPDALFVTADTVPLFTPSTTITTVHDIAFERFPELYRGKSVQRSMGFARPLIHVLVRLLTLGRYSASERDYHRWSVRHALRVCKHIFTVSEFSKQEIVSILGARPESISVTHLGVQQESAFQNISAEEKAAVQKKLSLPSRFAVFIGRLETKKNIDVLLQGYTMYRQQCPDPIDLVLAGNPGFGWDEAWARVPESVRPSIHRLGFISDQELHAVEVMATLSIMISRYEGFGMPPVESLAAGVPVVASRAGSLPEVLGDAAAYVEVDDVAGVASAIDSLARDQHRRNDLISKGRRWAQRYTWEATASTTAQKLRSILNLPETPKNGTV
jgi:glycosyltransferase involved in cell wall biosynthesis